MPKGNLPFLLYESDLLCDFLHSRFRIAVLGHFEVLLELSGKSVIRYWRFQNLFLFVIQQLGNLCFD
ncbi:hypothetical protein SLEP1_g6688 [Rubroshorea leprosula]|uniref:Uncharacterized protein n=1 Tax=Rubroshorea leprosula TaxID=152421 RepID=A0AAV5I6Y8_9ROSI|nr:hypothetical protein SLEP1_g6688 [Rubroshorea leprosula]